MVSTTDEVISEVPAVETIAEIKEISEEEFEKAQKTFQLGKKNLFLNKYDESVNNIGEACKIYSAKFGEFDPQCAEIYFFYGRALLELARVENTVLGNALNGVPEDNSPIDDSRYGNPEDVAAEEKKEISEKVIDALCESEDITDKTAEANGTTATSEIKTDEDKSTEEKTKEEKSTEEKPIEEKPIEVKPVEEKSTEEKPKEEMPVVEDVKMEETKEDSDKKETQKKEENGHAEKKETEEKIETENGTSEKKEGENGHVEKKDGEGEEEEEESGDEEAEEADDAGEDISKNAKDEAEAEEISNLQRSWEMFELAKLVYTKNYENDLVFKNKRVAECLLKLGEISIEQEIYDQAINDITESIKLQEEQSERDERMLAESFYQLGLSQQFNNMFNEANESYQKSINIMQLRIEKLKAKLTQCGEEVDSESEKITIKDEITELEALLPEMLSKLEEVNEQGQQSLSLIKEAKECFINSVTSEAKTNGTSTNGEVKDITSLVKSKRKISANEEISVKKTRLSESEETSTNGNVEMSENEKKISDETIKPADTASTEEKPEQPAEETNGTEKIVVDEVKEACEAV